MNQTILTRLAAITEEEQAILRGEPLRRSNYGEG